MQLVVYMMVAVVVRMMVDCDQHLAESLLLLWLHMLHSMQQNKDVSKTQQNIYDGAFLPK